MSQKSSLPQAAKSVSRVLVSDTFILYGGVNGLMPVLALHLLLLPLNIRRLIEAGRPTEKSSIHLPRATSKATQMAIEALLVADAMRAQQRLTSRETPTSRA